MKDFRSASSEPQRTGMVSQFLYFLKTSKKWWLLPIIIVLVGLACGVPLRHGRAPFIYTLF